MIASSSLHPQTLTLARPDDWHLHLRDGAVLATTVAHSARQFRRAIVMPNLQPPVTTVAQALAYRERILDSLPDGGDFEPLMTLYLTDATTPDEIARAAGCEHVHACKLYPAGATTNSAAGVTALDNIGPVLEAMQRHNLPLLIHGEVVDPAVDVFDREAVFVDTLLTPLVARLPALRVVLEHVTTAEAVAFVRAAPANVAATITAQHLLYNRNAIFRGGVRPHHYCLPILKRERHRRALVEAATGGETKFFLGSDSAPHARSAKENACGCAGCYTASHALELYAEAFEDAGALDRLEGFASRHGAAFYRLPPNTGQVTLRREEQTVPDGYRYGDDDVVPLRAGETLRWRFVG